MGPSKHFPTSPSECLGPSKPLQTKPSEGMLLSGHLSTTSVRGCWGFQASLGGGSFSPRPGSDTTHQPKPGSNIIISLFRIKAPHVRGYAAAAPFHQKPSSGTCPWLEQLRRPAEWLRNTTQGPIGPTPLCRFYPNQFCFSLSPLLAWL